MGLRIDFLGADGPRFLKFLMALALQSGSHADAGTPYHLHAISPGRRIARKIPERWSSLHPLRLQIDDSYQRLIIGIWGPAARDHLSGASSIGGHSQSLPHQPECLQLHVPTLISLEMCDGGSVPSHASQTPCRNRPSAALWPSALGYLPRV